jgi:hypothetical protein
VWPGSWTASRCDELLIGPLREAEKLIFLGEHKAGLWWSVVFQENGLYAFPLGYSIVNERKEKNIVRCSLGEEMSLRR